MLGRCLGYSGEYQPAHVAFTICYEMTTLLRQTPYLIYGAQSLGVTLAM